MKLFIAALVTLCLIAGFCLVTTAMAKDALNGISGKLSELDGTFNSVPNGAEKISEEIVAMWDKDFFTVSMLIPHHYLDEVKERLLTLRCYSTAGEFADWYESKERAKQGIEHILGLLKANADNIL